MFIEKNATPLKKNNRKNNRQKTQKKQILPLVERLKKFFHTLKLKSYFVG